MSFGMRHHGRRLARGSAIAVAAIVTIALLGGCSSGSSKTESIAKTKVLAAQHQALTTRFNVLTRQTQAVERTSRVVAANRARLKAALRHTWQQRAAANRAEQQRARRAAGKPGFVEVFSSTDVCDRNHANKHERQQALHYLNLSCPAS
jgi:outer membrane murein-binding lipoprotein Lpp